ncbi:MAG: 4Fe-4S dicluster domain-containing protein [Candidatus Bathyarchaeia archaeon]
MNGEIVIDREKCKGVLCQQCVTACPERALVWIAYPGEIRVEKNVCRLCMACVVSCPVENCIKVVRKRSSGKVEIFGTLRDALRIVNDLNAKKRLSIVSRIRRI